MNKSALILHAWYSKPENHWYPWLKKELETKGYSVFLSELPTMNTDLPDLQKQLDFIQNEVKIDENTVIFGHSLGCLLGMRIAEKQKFQSLFLVAGWDFDELTPEHKLFWQTKIDHEKIKKNVSNIYCFSSDNDPYITAFTAEEMSKRLGGTFILKKGAGHFTLKDKILKIKELLALV